MSDPIKVLVSLEEELDSELAQAVLAIEPGVRIVGMAEDLEGRWSSTADQAADLLMVACKGYSQRALAFIDRTVSEHPDRPVVVLSEGPANGFVRRVFEAGADDILTLPGPGENGTPAATEDIVFMVEKAVARKRGSFSLTRSDHGGLICVLGPKGGIGKTLTAANLAVSLAERRESVMLLDLDLQFGDAALALGISPARTMYDLATSSGALDVEKIDAYLADHESGLRVLPAPIRPDQASAVTTEFLRELYPMLRSAYGFVVIDTPPGFTPEVIATIDSSTDVCMVGTPDSLSLKNCSLGLETLRLMGYPEERVSLVLNRADSRVGISREDVLEILGRPADVLVPSSRDIARSVNEGLPIVSSAPRSEAARAFAALAERYRTARVEEATPRTNGQPRRANGHRRGRFGRRR
jgi:pilus assembly protein CpaE